MEEKTEKPTQHKLKKTKERGVVAKSSELISALVLFGSLALLWSFADIIEGRFKQVFASLYFFLREPDIGEASYLFLPLLYPTLLILVGIFLIGLFSQFLQIGWVWNWKRSRKKAQCRWIFLSIKLGVVFSIGYMLLLKEKPFNNMLLASSSEKVIFIFKKVFFLLLKISVALLLLGICDFFYQKWKHYRQMHMTKQEVREEKRETEGGQKNKLR